VAELVLPTLVDSNRVLRRLKQKLRKEVVTHLTVTNSKLVLRVKGEDQAADPRGNGFRPSFLYTQKVASSFPAIRHRARFHRAASLLKKKDSS